MESEHTTREKTSVMTDSRSPMATSSEPSSPESPTPEVPESPQGEQKPSYEAWTVFASTFGTIFLCELGDKTQVATLLMSAESQEPWVVFAGAATALVATSLLGVWVGQWLASRVSPKTLERSAAVVLLFIAASLFWDVLA